MGPNDYITVLIGVAGVTGGFFGGKRIGHGQATALAVDTVELLTLAVGELRTQGNEKDQKISDLSGRVGALESLVTQRAEVAAVHTDVREVMTIVDRIAGKLDV